MTKFYFVLLSFLLVAQVNSQSSTWANYCNNDYFSDDVTGTGEDLSGSVYVTVHSHFSSGPSGANTVTNYWLYNTQAPEIYFGKNPFQV
ncbi:MAG: hypothetical protein JWO32_2897 [Bacteroidetes bacterium]|nr:hypothetical protein [Bacteroidota bacterium]